MGIGQGYWVATPIQMVKALTTLINNGQVKTPHLLYSLQQGNRVTRYQPPMQTVQIGDPHSPYWGIVRNGMYGMANLPNGTGYKLFHTAPYQIAAKSGTSQVFSLKQNQTYNAKMIRCGCAITSSIRCSRLTKPPGGDGADPGKRRRRRRGGGADRPRDTRPHFDPANAPQPGNPAQSKPQLNDSADVQR